MMGELKLGPTGYTKIAILGSAPSSIALAPFEDPSWAIWVCSPAAFATVASRRSDVWFETHRFLPSEPGKSGAPGTRPWFSPEFHQFLRDHKGPVFMSQVDPTIPNSVRIPFEELLKKYGPYHFCSTIPWMLALAIEQMPKAIGLWGIDMSSSEEYVQQRPACQHFMGMAKALGIEVVLPLESDLMRPPLIYGLGELNPRHIKLSSYLDMHHKERGLFRQQLENLKMQEAYVTGRIDALTYVLQNWSDDIEPDIAQAMSLAAQYVVPSTGADVRDIKDAMVISAKDDAVLARPGGVHFVNEG